MMTTPVGAWGLRRRAGTTAVGILLSLVALAPSAPRASGATPPDISTESQAPSPNPAANRIISLIPAVTEMLFAMGAGPQVVGVSSYGNFPPEVRSRPKVGALVDPDFERILSLRPDLVIVYGTQSDLIDRLRRARIPLFEYQHSSLGDIPVTIRRLGDRVGHADEARRVAAQIDTGLAAVRRRVAGRPRPRTALVFERDPGTLRGMFASAGVGFMHDLLIVAGGDDVFADVARQSLQLSTELLLARAPQVIVEIRSTTGWTPDRIAKERAIWQTLPTLPAVRSGQVHILADDRLNIPGPRVAAAAELLANVLHPQSR